MWQKRRKRCSSSCWREGADMGTLKGQEHQPAQEVKERVVGLLGSPPFFYASKPCMHWFLSWMSLGSGESTSRGGEEGGGKAIREFISKGREKNSFFRSYFFKWPFLYVLVDNSVQLRTLASVKCYLLSIMSCGKCYVFRFAPSFSLFSPLLKLDWGNESDSNRGAEITLAYDQGFPFLF